MSPGRRKLVRPLFLFAGIAYVIGGIIKYAMHQDFAQIYVICGLAFMVAGWLFGRQK
jgi:glucose dehydrogenase